MLTALDQQEELEAALTAATKLWDGVTRGEMERALNELCEDPEDGELNMDRFAVLAYLDDCYGGQVRRAVSA